MSTLSVSEMTSSFLRIQKKIHNSGYPVYVEATYKGVEKPLLLVVGDRPFAMGYLVPFSSVWKLHEIFDECFDKEGTDELVDVRAKIAELSLPIDEVEDVVIDSMAIRFPYQRHFFLALSDNTGRIQLLEKNYTGLQEAH